MGGKNLALLAAGFSLALSLACSQPQPQGHALPRQESEKICYFPSGFEDTLAIEQTGRYRICEIPEQFKAPEAAAQPSKQPFKACFTTVEIKADGSVYEEYEEREISYSQDSSSVNWDKIPCDSVLRGEDYYLMFFTVPEHLRKASDRSALESVLYDYAKTDRDVAFASTISSDYGSETKVYSFVAEAYVLPGTKPDYSGIRIMLFELLERNIR